MLYTVDTKKSVESLREALTKACADHKFGVLGVYDLRAKMREKGVEYAHECLVFEVCNPEKAKQVLEANPDVSTALPCRVSVYRTREGTTRIATLLPTKLMESFGTVELRGVASEVEATLKAIVDQAAGQRQKSVPGEDARRS